LARKLINIYTKNDQFQYIETLRRNREKRHRSGEFFIEGVRPINLALQHHWQINAFVYAHDVKLSGWARDILHNSPAPRHYVLPHALLQELSQKEDTSELLALVAIPPDDVNRISLHRPFTAVVFDRPASPGNLGTLIRSCDAFGVAGVIVTGHAVDVYSPETISASTGSFFAVPVIRLGSSTDLLPWLAELRNQFGAVNVVGTDEKGEVEISQHDFTLPTVLLAGNETWGLSKAFLELCDTVTRIPIAGSASSLNVACATSIVLYEINRQRAVHAG
jgi:TrmH family RNA methyltransferase